MQTATFSGRITSKDDQTIKADDNGTIKSFNIPGSVGITKDTFQSSLDKLNVGDTVDITYDSNSDQVVSVNATSAQLLDWSKIGIPAIILTLLIAGLAYYLMRRARRGSIKTAISDRPGSAS